MKTLGFRLAEARKNFGLTQKQVADYLHCDQSLYSKYERGERAIPLAAMIELAKLYKTSLDYLAGLTAQRKPYP